MSSALFQPKRRESSGTFGDWGMNGWDWCRRQGGRRSRRWSACGVKTPRTRAPAAHNPKGVKMKGTLRPDGSAVQMKQVALASRLPSHDQRSEASRFGRLYSRSLPLVIGDWQNESSSLIQKKTAGDTPNRSLSLRICSFVSSRLPLSTSDTTLSVPNTSTKSF